MLIYPFFFLILGTLSLLIGVTCLLCLPSAHQILMDKKPSPCLENKQCTRFTRFFADVVSNMTAFCTVRKIKFLLSRL